MELANSHDLRYKERAQALDRISFNSQTAGLSQTTCLLALQCHTVSLEGRQCVQLTGQLLADATSKKQFKLACTFLLLEFFRFAPTQLDAAG